MSFWRRKTAAVPEGMADWGLLGYRTLQEGHVQLPDLRTHVPRTRVGDQRVWPGLQLRNGVSQLSPILEVRTGSGVPFWQLQQLRQPATYTKFGGSPGTPTTPAVIQASRQDYYAGQDVDGSGQPAPLGRLARLVRL